MPNPMLEDQVFKRLRDGDRVLDVGSGEDWVKKTLAKAVATPFVLTLDICAACQPDVLWDASSGLGIFTDRSFDLVLLLDIIEHLEKGEGQALIREAQRVARREILLLTPLWWTDNNEPYEDPSSVWYQSEEVLHRSLWTAADLEKPGWARLPLADVNEYWLGSWQRNVG